MKKRVAQFMVGTECPTCHGKRLRPESLSVKFTGHRHCRNLAAAAQAFSDCIRPYAHGTASGFGKAQDRASGKGGGRAAHREDLVARLSVMLDLGLGYLARSQYPDAFAGRAPTAAARHPGALEPVRRGLCARRAVGRASSRRYGGAARCARAAEGVREFAVRGRARARRDPSRRLDRRCRSGAGEQGGFVLYSGPPAGLGQVEASQTRRFLFGESPSPASGAARAKDWLASKGVTRNNLERARRRISLGVFTTVTGVSGSGKSSLVSQVLVELVAEQTGPSSPAG